MGNVSAGARLSNVRLYRDGWEPTIQKLPCCCVLLDLVPSVSEFEPSRRQDSSHLHNPKPPESEPTLLLPLPSRR